MLVDSHAHIDLPQFSDDLDQVLARAHQQGVGFIVNVGLDLESSRTSLLLAQQHEGVFTTVGFHPGQAPMMTGADLASLAELAGDSRVVAVGEIGLDFYRGKAHRQQQLEVFRQQLGLAAELGLPVVIHCRQAHHEVLDILDGWGKSLSLPAGGRGVMHCFSGDIELARRYIELGFLISIAGPVTYPSAIDRVDVARELPLDRLVVETDSPFLSPQLYRGKRNEPAYVSLVVDRIAQIRQVPGEVVAQATAQNAIALFGLPTGEKGGS